MHRVGGFINWIGGGISRVAASGLVIAVVFLIFGVTPPELITSVITNPPAWLLNGWTKLIILVAGLALIAISLRFNIWSRIRTASTGDALGEARRRVPQFGYYRLFLVSTSRL